MVLIGDNGSGQKAVFGVGRLICWGGNKLFNEHVYNGAKWLMFTISTGLDKTDEGYKYKEYRGAIRLTKFTARLYAHVRSLKPKEVVVFMGTLHKRQDKLDILSIEFMTSAAKFMLATQEDLAEANKIAEMSTKKEEEKTEGFLF
ncbi:MAG: hypothetical protein IKU30_01035 [Clostridia bacterium]|nr:hypothetical protein [Clostridia bacterium]